ncbi:MAG: hypothetical protein RI947_419 [Candidatus Parcubacteria bacterium]|jgi:hypothetical protein
MKTIIGMILIVSMLIYPTALSAHSRHDYETDKVAPLFTLSNMLPGAHVQKSMKVVNKLSNPQKISVYATLKNSKGRLKNVLHLAIFMDKNNIKSISFIELLAKPIDIGSLKPGEARTVVFDVEMPASAGNKYQQSSVVFDLHVGMSGPSKHRHHFWQRWRW